MPNYPTKNRRMSIVCFPSGFEKTGMPHSGTPADNGLSDDYFL